MDPFEDSAHNPQHTKMPTTRTAALAKITRTVLSTPELLNLILSCLPQQDLLLNAQIVCKTWRALTKSQPLLRQTLYFDPSPDEPPRLNPLLVKAFPIFFRKEPVRPRVFDRLPFTRDPEAFRRKGATWREMLVLSSGGEVRAVHRWSRLGGSHERVGKVPGGLTMGACWDVTRSLCGDPLNSIYWCWRDDIELKGQKIGGKYQRVFEGTEELEIRLESSVPCVAVSFQWESEEYKAYERAREKEEREREREEDDAYFRCEGVGEVGVQYGEDRLPHTRLSLHALLEVYAREMEEAANMPLPDEDDGAGL